MFSPCSPKIRPVNSARRATAPMRKLTRKEIKEGLDTVPIEGILGKHVSRELTAKQKKFALEVASGQTKAEAYRRAYKASPTQSTILNEPYRVATNPRVSAEIAAYQAAIEAARYRTPAALRELVIQSLVTVIIDPDAKDSVKVSAAKILGTVTEVAAFTERKEIKTISSSDDAKTKIMGELKRIIKESATDADIIEAQADDLLRELTNDAQESTPGEKINEAAAEPHPSPTPQTTEFTGAPDLHTIPHEQTHQNGDTPPSFLAGTIDD